MWFQPLSLAWVPHHAVRTFEPTIIPLAFAFCLPAATQIRRLPGLGGIVYRLSLQSYSLYLLHVQCSWPSTPRPAYHLPVAECVLLSIVLIAALSTAVTKWVEPPVMALRPQQHPFRPGPITRRAQGPSYTVLSSRLKSTGGVNENA
jgi:peptidoglycan/LPS O-acetylase OafA/YrhL